MSKVQRPKSEDDAAIRAPGGKTQAESADLGPWTLDIGQRPDIGLRVTDLRKSFTSPSGERIEVLRGVEFSAAAGEAIAITGSSGAGKSTFLHLLGGLEAADHGSMVVDQFAIERASPSALAHFRNAAVGFVFQFHHLLPDLTAAENVSVPLLIKRIRRRQALSRAKQMVAEAGLERRVADSLVGHLSGGEQQRVAICRALIARPALVLADEPTGNLDSAIGDEIAHSLVAYARETPAIVIIATHNLRLAETCDRTLILQDGRFL